MKFRRRLCKDHQCFKELLTQCSQSEATSDIEFYLLKEENMKLKN